MPNYCARFLSEILKVMMLVLYIPDIPHYMIPSLKLQLITPFAMLNGHRWRNTYVFSGRYKANVQSMKSKCRFVQNEVVQLGYRKDEQSTHPTEEHFEAI